MLKKILILIAAIVVIVFGVVVWNGQDSSEDNSNTIFVNMYPAYDVVKNVVGGEFNVELVTRAGVDPHDYEPTGRQIADIEDSAMFVWFEGIGSWEEEVVESLDDTVSVNLTDASVKILEIDEDEHHDDEEEHDHDEDGDEHKDEDGEHHHEEGEDEHHDDEKKKSDDHDHDHSHDHGGKDPHVWLDSQNMQAYARKISEEVSLLDPDNSSLYETNANSYIQELTSLDNDIQSALASCNVDSVVTSHDAFGYLGSRYGFEILSISGIDPTVEPSANELTEITSKINEVGLDTVLFETQISPDFANLVAQETGSSLDVIYSMESPTSDEINEFSDYLGFMRQNQEVLTAALDCN